MTDLEKQIHHARPTLRTVAPLTNAILLIFGVFNIILAISLYYGLDRAKFSAPLIIVNDVFNYHVWAFVFLVVGIMKLYSIATNNWSLSRSSLLIGVAIKAAWAIALIVRAATTHGTIFLSLLWVVLAVIQITTYIYFMPPSIGSTLQLRKDRFNE